MEDTQPVGDEFVDHSGRNSPDSSDSDAVNTSSARVYFGPLQSAEKERAQRVNLGQPTPVKRSTRFSSIAALQVQDSSRNVTGTGAAEQESNLSSRSETPATGEDLYEEPSSALASKVLHAWDNPSPPPSPPPELAATSAPTSELDNDILAPNDPGSELVNNNTMKNVLPQRFDEESLPVSSNETSGNQATTAELSSEPVEEDLIIFDSPSTAPRMRSMPVTPPIPSRSTVDDLLALSPVPPLAEPTLPATVASEEDEAAQIISSPPRESTPSVADEAEVAFSLSNDVDAVTSSPVVPSTEGIPQSDLITDIPLVVLSVTPEPEPQTPSLRRSTRPRRSVSPFVLPLTSTPAKLAVTPNGPVSSTPNASATRKRKAKTKEPHTSKSPNPKSPNFDTITADKAEIPATPRPPNSTIDVLLEELNNDVMAQVVARDSGNTDAEPSPHGSAESVATASKPTIHRLGSLSSTSHDVLTHLLPPPGTPIDGGAPTHPANADISQTISSTPKNEPITTFSGITTPSTLPSTPVKSTAPDNLRTPARRVAIKEAVAQGSLSPEKARTLLASARPIGPMFGTPGMSSTPRAAHDPPRSPAKRVLVQDAPHAFLSPHKGKTPVRPPIDGRARSSSVDIIPAPALFPKTQRSASVEPPKPRIPTFRKPSSTDGTTASLEGHKPLPFPILPRLPSTIVEVDERTPSPPSQQQPTKPPSSLRQLSAKAESKIPRPGSKPYARPIPSSSTASSSRVPGPSATKKVEPPSATAATTAHPRPMRLVRRVSTKPVTVDSSSDTDTVQPVAGPGPRTLAHRTAQPTAQNPTVATLKRKRDIPESKASPPGAKPVVLLRRVVRPSTTTKTLAVKSPSPARRPSPSRARGVANSTAPTRVQMRKVVDTRKPKEAPVAVTSPQPVEQETKETRIPRPPIFSAKSPDRQSAIVEVMSSPIVGNSEDSPHADQEPHAAEVAETTNAGVPESTSTPPQDRVVESQDLQDQSEPETNGLRRTSRRRKSAQSTSDVFGPVTSTSTSTRQSQPRYKSVLPPDNSAFSGMSALALKTLTATNTVRNQKQVSELQLEVILKEGKRPESPTTKVRTTLDKQKEEKALQRQERAARRARKAAKAGEGDESDAAGEDPDASFMSMDEEPVQLSKHTRGAGEDEDYETPERPERPLKRGRFEEGGHGDDAGLSNGEDRLEKRVKWDRGLAKTFFLTGTPPNPRRPPKEELTKKGCLTTKAKTLRLDTLGNVLNAEIPVPDIVPESIVVQKFVYEDDLEAQPEPSSPAKATRSKTKKKS